MSFDIEWRRVEWNEKEIEKRKLSSIVNADGRIYLFGGKSEQGLHNDIFEYDCEEQVWKRIRVIGDLPPQQCKSFLRYDNKKIYLCGGQTNEGFSRSLYYFDLTLSQWSRITPKEYSQTPPATEPQTIILHFPYLIQLHIQFKYKNERLWVYNIEEGQWKSIQFSGLGLYFNKVYSAGTMNKKLYVYGAEKDKEPKLGQCNLADLLDSNSYQDLSWTVYTLTRWRKDVQVISCLDLQVYDGQIKIVQKIKGNGLDFNRALVVNLTQLYWTTYLIYGNMTNFQSASTTIVGSSLVAVGQLYGSPNQKLCYLNFFKHTRRGLIPLQSKRSDKGEEVILVINNEEYKVSKDNLTKHFYFNYLLEHHSNQNRHQITIMEIDQKYITEFVNFLEDGIMSFTQQDKGLLYTRIINLAYLADYFGLIDLKSQIQSHLLKCNWNAANLQTIMLANMLNLSRFQELSSRFFISTLKNEEIQNLLSHKTSSILCKLLQENYFDFKHRIKDNSHQLIGSWVVKREKPTTSPIAQSFIEKMLAMLLPQEQV